MSVCNHFDERTGEERSLPIVSANMLRFDLERIQRMLLSKRLSNERTATRRAIAGQGRRRAQQEGPRKTGAEFPRCLMEDLMSIWTCVLGWFRFTVPDSTADEVMSRIGGEWIKDKKGFLGYRQGWLSRGNAGGIRPDRHRGQLGSS